jgi:hypothetical protein
MPYLLIKRRVKDYSAWKPVFDKHSSTAKANGSKGGYLFRSGANPNELVILFEWDDLKKACEYAHSEDLRKTMERAELSVNLSCISLKKLRDYPCDKIQA